MSLHDDIMNIKEEAYHDEAYSQGHKDARHAAAELAIKHDDNVQQIMAELAEAQKKILNHLESGERKTRQTLDLTDLTGEDAKRVQTFVSGLPKVGQDRDHQDQDHG